MDDWWGAGEAVQVLRWESSGGNLGDPIRPTALAEPDLEGYTIRLPV